VDFGVHRHTSNYSILIIFSIISFALMRRTSVLQSKAAKKYGLPLLKYDAEIWKIDSYLELGILANLLTGLILSYYKMDSVARIIDSATAIILLIVALKVPLTHGKEALFQLLDKTLPEHVQFDILSVISENIGRICEFRAVHSRRSGKDIFIEIDVVLPYDYTLEQAFILEQDIQKNLILKYSNAITRLYVIPCKRDCIHNDKRNCPVKIANQDIL
jgi:divalent metal cation (Fe/Co/Zn/Cd) transporter